MNRPAAHHPFPLYPIVSFEFFWMGTQNNFWDAKKKGTVEEMGEVSPSRSTTRTRMTCNDEKDNDGSRSTWLSCVAHIWTRQAPYTLDLCTTVPARDRSKITLLICAVSFDRCRVPICSDASFQNSDGNRQWTDFARCWDFAHVGIVLDQLLEVTPVLTALDPGSGGDVLAADKASVKKAAMAERSLWAWASCASGCGELVKS